MNHSNDVIKKLNEIKIGIVELHYEGRSYLIKNERNYLLQFDSLSEKLETDINAFNLLSNFNEDQRKILNEVNDLLTENIRLLRQLFIESESSKSADFRNDRYENNFIKNLDKMNVLINDLKLNELIMLNSRSERADRSNKRVQNFIILTGLFAFTTIGLSLYISDRLIKNKKIAEDLLLKSYEELEDRVDERTRELEDTNSKLSSEIEIRTKTEETLRESEQRFRMMADSAPVLIWISGKDKLCTYFNKAWLDFRGRTLEQEVGNGWIEGIHPDDKDRVLKVYNEAFDKKDTYEIELRLKNYKDEYIWIFNKGVPRFAGIEFTGYIGSCIDINERKRNEKYLNLQYEISKTLADSKSLEEASQKLLNSICGGIEWNFGILWLADEMTEMLKAEYLWSSDKNEINLYTELFSDSLSFKKGTGFPGSVIKEAKSLWTKELVKDKDFIRREVTSKLGWNSRLGIPISNGKNVIAIIECFSKKSIEEKQDTINILESAGRQIGNFIERIKAEENLRRSNLELEEKVNERTNELANALKKLIRESEEKEKFQNRIKLFAHTIRSIQDSIFIADLNNKIIFVNKKFKETYGYEDIEIIGEEIPILKNLSFSLREEIFANTIKEGWRGELMSCRSDGSSFNTFLSTSSIKDEEGKAAAWVGICQDITELKKKEELIIKRNNLLNVLNDVIRHTNNSYDFNESIQFSIDKICDFTNWEIGHYLVKEGESFVSSGIWNSKMKTDLSQLRQISESMEFNDNSEFPVKNIESGKSAWRVLDQISSIDNFKRRNELLDRGLKTGIWIPVAVNKKVIGALEFFKKEEETLPDPEIQDCLLNIGVELGSMHEKLDVINLVRKSEKNLKIAQSIAKVGSWEWDIPKNSITWSDELYDIYEIDKDSSEITYEEYLKRLHPEDRGLAVRTVNEALENKTPFSYYHRIVTAGNNVKFIKAQGEVYLDENNNVVRMLGTGQDVTDIIKAEEELKRINEKLIDTQKDLIYNEKLAALGRFSSGIAHEIRNPLANINSLAQLISKSLTDEKDKQKIHYILTNVEIANKIIKSLLNYASPEDLKLENIYMNDLINNIIENINERIISKGITLIKEIPEELPPMSVDKLRFENAIMNFISNSIDAMSQGGKLTIKLNVMIERKELRIEIMDTGIGIPPENLDKILEPFFTTKDDGIGLGMGLAYQTIRLHDGTLDIKSEEGSGTHVIIKLPIKNK